MALTEKTARKRVKNWLTIEIKLDDEIAAIEDRWHDKKYFYVVQPYNEYRMTKFAEIAIDSRNKKIAKMYEKIESDLEYISAWEFHTTCEYEF